MIVQSEMKRFMRVVLYLGILITSDILGSCTMVMNGERWMVLDQGSVLRSICGVI